MIELIRRYKSLNKLEIRTNSILSGDIISSARLLGQSTELIERDLAIVCSRCPGVNPEKFMINLLAMLNIRGVTMTCTSSSAGSMRTEKFIPKIWHPVFDFV